MNSGMRSLLEKFAARTCWNDQLGLNLEDLVERSFDPYDEGVQDGMTLLARGLLEEFGGAGPPEEDPLPVAKAGRCEDCRFFSPSKVETLREELPCEGVCTWEVPSWPSVWPEAANASGEKPPSRPASRPTLSNFGRDCQVFSPTRITKEVAPDAPDASE